MPTLRMKSIRRRRFASTTSRNSSVPMRLTSLSSQGSLSSPSTEYIHLTAASIALRQLSTQAAGSICNIFSAETATSAKEVNLGSERKMSKLVMGKYLVSSTESIQDVDLCMQLTHLFFHSNS